MSSRTQSSVVVEQSTNAGMLATRGSRSSGSGLIQDDGLDAPGRPDSRGSHNIDSHEMGFKEDDFDGMEPASMESDGYAGDHHGENSKKDLSQLKPSAFIKFKRGLRALWSRKLTDEPADQETLVKRTLRELVVYCIFLLVLSAIVFGMTSPNMFYFTNLMQGLFIDTVYNDTRSSFRQGVTIADFWRYANPTGNLQGGLFGWESFYNSQPNPEANYVLFENKLLGVPRMRQVRVRNDSCTVHPDFSDSIKQCYAAYSAAAEDNSTFGPGGDTPWIYQNESQLNGRSYLALVSTYGGGGYVVNLNKTAANYGLIVQNLMDHLWIDRATRAVFVDFTVYNANINLFCVVKLIAEFPPTGGMVTSFSFRTVKLIRYVTTADYCVMICEGIFVLFTLYYFIEEALEVKALGLKKYFKDIWNWLDCVIILISLICAVFNVYRTSAVGNLLESLLKDPDVFADFDFLSYWQEQFNFAIAVLVFVSWMKTFKYISFNKTMKQLSTTMSRCKNDLLGFGVMFAIIFVAFTQLAYLLFGTQIQDFRDFINAAIALFRILLGDFDFHQLESAQRVLGPIFFIAYMFFVFFVLLNMFLAIIGDTYSEVKAETANEKSEFELSEFFQQKYTNMLGKLKTKRAKLDAMQNALTSSGGVNVEEFKTQLKASGYSDIEIDVVVKKYDPNNDAIFSKEEIQQMREDMEGQRANLTREYSDMEDRVAANQSRPKSGRSRSDSSDDDEDDDSDIHSRVNRTSSGRPIVGLTQDEFTVLTRRVDRMEHSIGSIVSKIDAVLIKLEAMEKAKLKRKETMGKLLDSINEADGTSEEMKRDQMERLVREELERWDTEGLPDQQSRVSMGSLGSIKAAQQSSSRAPSGKKK